MPIRLIRVDVPARRLTSGGVAGLLVVPEHTGGTPELDEFGSHRES
jgi:hypothetical protein